MYLFPFLSSFSWCAKAAQIRHHLGVPRGHVGIARTSIQTP